MDNITPSRDHISYHLEFLSVFFISKRLLLENVFVFPIGIRLLVENTDTFSSSERLLIENTDTRPVGICSVTVRVIPLCAPR